MLIRESPTKHSQTKKKESNGSKKSSCLFILFRNVLSIELCTRIPLGQTTFANPYIF